MLLKHRCEGTSGAGEKCGLTHYGDKILQKVLNEARQEGENIFVR